MECHTYSMRSENKKKYIKKGRRSPKSCDNIQWVMAMTGTTSIFLCKYILYVKSLNDCRLFCTLHSSPNAACTASDVCVCSCIIVACSSTSPRSTSLSARRGGGKDYTSLTSHSALSLVSTTSSSSPCTLYILGT